MVPVDQLWQSVRREAEAALVSDPLFGASLSAAILDHSDLGSALAHQIGERLGRRADDREQFARVAREAFAAAPELVEAASRDLQSIAAHDPAMKRLLPPLLNFKGYVALQAWRVSNWLWRRVAAILHYCCKACRPIRLQVSIHPSASIGTSVFLDHATGIIMGAFAEIGDEVTIMQNVTIGRKQALPGRAPRSAAASCSARAPRFWATSVSATSPGSAPVRWSSMTCPPDAPRSACRRGSSIARE